MFWWIDYSLFRDERKYFTINKDTHLTFELYRTVSVMLSVLHLCSFIYVYSHCKHVLVPKRLYICSLLNVVLYGNICLRWASNRSTALCVTIRSVCFCISYTALIFTWGLNWNKWSVKSPVILCVLFLQSLWTYWYIHYWTPLGLDIVHLSSH